MRWAGSKRLKYMLSLKFGSGPGGCMYSSCGSRRTPMRPRYLTARSSARRHTGAADRTAGAWDDRRVDRATVDLYEREAATYEARRQPRHRARAEAFGRRVGGGPVADLGCEPGWYTDALGAPAVALDAATAMLRRTRAVAPGCLPVRDDLGRLPFRRGALAGAWARNSYV